jgi:CheY-like chemotaxis protein
MGDRKRRVLLVDDEPSIIKMVGKRLELEGFEVLVAVDGQEAIEKALASPPDIIVLDLMLPKISGFDVCERLKQSQQAKEIPIIAIFSGRGKEGDAERCKKLGAAAYVPKGHGASPLIEEIKSLLASAG